MAPSAPGAARAVVSDLASLKAKCLGIMRADSVAGGAGQGRGGFRLAILSHHLGTAWSQREVEAGVQGLGSLRYEVSLLHWVNREARLRRVEGRLIQSLLG